MSKYVMCLGETGHRRAMVRFIQRTGHDALACDSATAVLNAIRERGLPVLLLVESFQDVRAARQAAPRLFEVGALLFEEFLRADRRTLGVLLGP
jgi:hypothetical protein